MNKQELIGHVADRAGLSRNDAARAVETTLEVITSALKRAQRTLDLVLEELGQTGLPITLAYVDVPSRRVGWGPTFHPTGDVKADMDLVREFYADKTGFHPEDFTPPRLREESTGTGVD